MVMRDHIISIQLPAHALRLSTPSPLSAYAHSTGQPTHTVKTQTGIGLRLSLIHISEPTRPRLI
eukprot:1641322-Rhodomonas_salina.1